MPRMSNKFDRFTKKARQVLTYAQEEAQLMNHGYIGTEHLLLGLVREGDGIAADVLQTLGINLDKLRSLTLQQMRETPAYAGEKGAKGEKKNDTPLVDQLGTDITSQAAE